MPGMAEPGLNDLALGQHGRATLFEQRSSALFRKVEKEITAAYRAVLLTPARCERRRGSKL